MLDKGEAIAGFGTVEREAHSDAAKKACLAVGGSDDLRCGNTHSPSFRWTTMSREMYARLTCLSNFSWNDDDRRKTPLPNEGTRGTAGSHPLAHRRERYGAPRHARAVAYIAERGRQARGRSPLNAVPPFSRRGRVVRGLLRLLDVSASTTRSGGMVGRERSRRAVANSAHRNLCLLRRNRANAREPSARPGHRGGRPAAVRAVSQLHGGGPSDADSRSARTRPPRAKSTRRGRPRPGLHNLALARARTRMHSERGSRHDVPAGRPSHADTA